MDYLIDLYNHVDWVVATLFLCYALMALSIAIVVVVGLQAFIGIFEHTPDQWVADDPETVGHAPERPKAEVVQLRRAQP